MQPYHVLEAQYRGGFVVWLRFHDGTAGEIDLRSELWGPVFEPLRDPGVFSQFKIDPLFHTARVAERRRHGAGVPPRQHPRHSLTA